MKRNEDNVTYEGAGTSAATRPNDLASKHPDYALKGAQLLARALQNEGVSVIFGYPGGANLEIFDVLHEYNIQCIRTEHEQGAVHAAQGYARSTGRVGVCLATSGPGATNLITGLADANSDSTPIVAITGNVPSHLLGKNAFQEVDIVSISAPITKKSTLANEVATIPQIVHEAFLLAGGNRPGPVLIDVPKDIQQGYPVDPEGKYSAPLKPVASTPAEPEVGGLTEQQLEQTCRLIAQSQRPIIYAGGGIVSSASSDELIRLAEKLHCPVTTTIMGHGAFPPDHELFLDTLGMHGARYANIAINEADLVLALGVRFDDRVTGNVDAFIAQGKIIHIDIDAKELNKNKTVTLPICADLHIALRQLCDRTQAKTGDAWVEHVQVLKARYPYPMPDLHGISPQAAIRLLSDMTHGEAIVSLGVGQHQMWAMQHYKSRFRRSFLSSSGFGTMGYGLPAAIGAKAGCPDRLVIDIDGDGSLNMSIHELATCRRFALGVKIVVINNQWLGMVRQWQDMIYAKHRAASDLSDPAAGGTGEIYPDFVKISEGYGIAAERVVEFGDLPGAFERMLKNSDEPYLLDIVVEGEANIYPMIPAGGTYRDTIMSDEDLADASDDKQGSNI